MLTNHLAVNQALDTSLTLIKQTLINQANHVLTIEATIEELIRSGVHIAWP